MPTAHRKSLVLLAYLSLEGPQGRKRLATLFWPSSDDPRNRLSVTLSRLRSDAPGSVVTTETVVATPLDSDVGVLRRALARGRVRLALQVYTGPFLAGASDIAWGEELQEWIDTTRDRLTGDLQAACLRLALDDADAGRFERGASLADAALRVGGTALLDPDDLRLLHDLLLAGGQRGAAAVRREAATLGISFDGSRESARARFAERPASPRWPRPDRGAATSFVGRSSELHDLGRALRTGDRRLVTLVGPSGIGKSRLALQLLADPSLHGRFPGGTVFASLDGCRDEASMAAAVLTAQGEGVPERPDGAANVVRRLRAPAALLVLDDIPPGAEIGAAVARWIRSCPELIVLATATEPLDIGAEWLVPIQGLGLPHPVGSAAGATSDGGAVLALFAARGRQADPGFRIQVSDEPAIAEIARRTGGSPLALELAASWVGSMGVPEIAAEVAHDLDFLRSSQRDRLERHRSMRAAFEYGWHRLGTQEQDCLSALSVFPGPFDAAAARSVAGAAAGTLAALVARSLVTRVGGDRFAVHAGHGPYLAERLAADPERAAVVRARLAALTAPADASSEPAAVAG